MKNCPFCAEEIQDEAIICKWCGHEIRNKISNKEKIKQERNTFIVWSIVVWMAALSLVIYFITSAVPEYQRSNPYEPLYAALGCTTNLSNLILLILSVKFSIKLNQRWWISVLLGLCVFLFYPITFVSLIIVANGKISEIEKISNALTQERQRITENAQ